MSGNRTSLKSNGATSEQGALKIIRPSQLAKDIEAGLSKAGVTVAAGVYEGSKPNKFNAANQDYFVRGTDNTLYILNSTSELSKQMSQLNADSATEIEVVYNGKKPTKSGKTFHDFEVFITNS